MKRSCNTCENARWSYLTPTGRVGRDAYGRCGIDVQKIIENAGPYIPSCAQVRIDKYNIVPENGEKCPLYMPLPKGEPRRTL